MSENDSGWKPHHSHWGAFRARYDGRFLSVMPHQDDPDPSPILRNVPGAAASRARIDRPHVRSGWLANGPGSDTARGSDSYVPVSWDFALGLVACELERVRALGNEHIFGGSYGWSSAGRVHHAQSLVHRFLNVVGGYTYSVNSYSAGASSVILPHIIAPMHKFRSAMMWEAISRKSQMVVAFGGMAAKNQHVAGGGPGRHLVSQHIRSAAQRGCRFVVVSPLHDDFPEDVPHDHIFIRPSTDTAMMLAIAYVLVDENLVDRDFVTRCCTGYDAFEAYLLGREDGTAKTPRWAEAITGIPAADIVCLARRMAARRTLITVSHSLQRAQYGEQPVWMGLVLATMLGQIGLDGGGYAYALGAFATVGMTKPLVPIPSVPQGRNPVGRYIPVARIADMLLEPGSSYEYNGQSLTYPEAKLVYWAGGNPFHHHQDLPRLTRAFARPETIVVHEPYWTSTAKHADIVLPSTITLERDDIGGSGDGVHVIAMHRLLEPFAEARNDYDTFADIAGRLGLRQEFTDGRTSEEWTRHLYGQLRQRLAEQGVAAPDFDAFWVQGELVLPAKPTETWLTDFRADPQRYPLETASGRIEITSDVVASFGYADCPGHPAWLEPDEWLGGELAERFPLQLVANQPAGRLHSQLDFAEQSQSEKSGGLECVMIHPDDAHPRRIDDGQLVRLFNDRGACLAIARLNDGNLRGVVQLPTGAWYDPQRSGADGLVLCRNGNPNVLTRDIGTSRLAQGSIGQLCLVEIVAEQSPPPRGNPYAPPMLADA